MKRRVCPIPMVLLVFISILAGCQTYGARRVQVTLLCRPQDRPARAYLVPLEAWETLMPNHNELQPYLPKDTVAFASELEPYRVKSSRTPVIASTMPYWTIYVVERDGRYWWDRIKPTAGEENRFNIETE